MEDISKSTEWTISIKALIKKGDKFLTLRRQGDHTSFPSLWDFPGGRLEQGEEPDDGVVREVQEETGLQIQPAGVLGQYEVIRDDARPVRFTLYSVELLSGDPEVISLDESEHSEYRLATAEEIERLKTVPFIEQYFAENE